MGEILLLLGIGLVTGMLSGLFGVGGGFVLVPLLALMGWDLPLAIGTSLLYVAAIGVGGAATHWRNRNLDPMFVAKFLLPAMLGAQGGAHLAVFFPEWVLSLAFAAFLVGVAASMRQSAPPQETQTRASSWGWVVGIGALVGVLSGLFGVGGGILFVPAQVHLFGMPIKRAVGNSMALVLLTGLSGVVAHAMLGTVAWQNGGILILGGAVGLQLGIRLLHRVSSERLRRYLVGLLGLMALYMLARGLAPWVGTLASGHLG